MRTRQACELCGVWDYLEEHHVFEGNGRRKIADEWGATVRICPKCHRDIHRNPKKYIWLKAKYQRLVMARYDLTEEEFVERIGKSYIWQT